MILLDYLIIKLIEWGVKAYRESKQTQAQQSTSGGISGTPPQRQRGAPRQSRSQQASQHSAREAAIDKALTASAENLERIAREFAQATDGEDQALQTLGEVASNVIAPAARDIARAAVRGAQGDPSWAASVQAQLRFHQRMFGGLEQIAAQRRDPQRTPMLHAADAVALACYLPLLEFQQRRGIPLSTTRPVAIIGESPGSLTPLFARTPVAPVEVSVRLQHDVAGWPLIAREVGRDIMISLEGYREAIRVAAGFPPPRPALGRGGITEDEVLAALGVWQVELSADVIGSIILGPAYLASLTMLHANPDQPFKTRVIQVSEGQILPEPPAELRVVAVAEALHRIGLTEDADRIVDQWYATHDTELEFYFPSGGGRYAAVPEDFYGEPVRRLARAICSHQVRELAGMHLLDVPGFHCSLSRRKETELVRDSYGRGGAPTGDPRALVSGAALLGYDDPSQRVPALARLRASLATEAEVLSRAAVALPGAGRREEMMAPQVIRDAVILQDILEPRFKGGWA